MTPAWNLVKRSPVQHKLVEAGAALEEISGWLLAKDFGDAEKEALAVRSHAGLADQSSSVKWEMKGADTESLLRSLLGKNVPQPGQVSAVSLGCVCRLSRNHALFILNPEESSLGSRLRQESSPSGCAHVTDRTSGLACFAVCGPRAGGVLRKLTSVDLRETAFPDLRCAFGPLAAIRVLILRKDRTGLPAYELFFNREYGEYLWDAVMEAGKEFHLRPFGSAAARLLES